MLSIQIEDVKSFMKHLLQGNTFDDFLLMHAAITTYNTFEIDGRVEKAFFGTDYDASPLYGFDYTPWPIAKKSCLDIIKGKYTPVSFRFVLYLGGQACGDLLASLSESAKNNVQAPVLNIRYDEHGLTLTTGLATHSFLLDKTAEETWDQWVSNFLGRYDLV